MRKINISVYKNICILLCLLLLVSAIASVPVSAEESQEKTVRTALFAGAYIQEDENGEKRGYGYEFQQAVASYTGWKYDYIECDWTDCYSRLENGEIDIMGGISYTDERAESMLFSDLPMGEEKYYLYANLADTDISITNLDSLNGKRIGVLGQSIPEKLLNQWEEKHNLHLQHVDIISADDILDKLADNKIDCFISSEDPVWGQSGISAVTLIGNSDIYYVINKDRPDLKVELDNAMREIEHDKPFYKEDLYKEYMSTESYEVLAEEEQNWLDRHGAIRVGYYKGDSGVSMIDSDTGELVGGINDYIKHASDCLGNRVLEFELIGFDTQPEEYEALKEDKIDMIFHVTQNPYQAEKNDLILSNEVFESSMAVMTTSDHFDEHEENVVAVDKDAVFYKWYITDNYPKWKIYECDTRDDMINAVQDGKADCFVIRARQSMKEYENKRIKSVFLTKSALSCFAVRRENTTLLRILNKTLDNLQTSQISGAVAAYDNALNKVTLSDFIKENWYTVTIIFSGIFLIILLIVIQSYRKTKKALAVAEKANAAKSDFLFNMSHDIRTPMNALIGYNELMKKELTDPKLLDYQQKIEQSGNLLLSIINNVLDMARIESGKAELDESYVNITETVGRIDSVFEGEAKKKGIRFIHEVNLEHPYIMCDIAKVHEILVNLISNAVKYTPDGGTVTIKANEIPDDKEGFVCIKIEVTDTGIGMSKEFLPSLFVPFARERNTTTGKVPGTGLGMPIIKKYIDMMGGTIEVESELGKGSRFTVILHHRIADKVYYEQKGNKDSVVNDKEIIQGKRILLAEDNDLNAEIAITILEDEGMSVDRVEDGVKCVAKMEQEPAGSYDLILMDIQMPNMDGYKATRTIRYLADKDKANIPIVAMTANAFEEDKQKAFSMGMNGHIAKPIDVEKVEQVLISVLKNVENKE